MNDYAKYFEGIKPQRMMAPTLPQLGTSPVRQMQTRMMGSPMGGIQSGYNIAQQRSAAVTPGQVQPGQSIPRDGGFGRPSSPAKPAGDGWFQLPDGRWGKYKPSGQSSGGDGPGGHLAFREWMMRYGGGGELDSTQMWQQYQDYLSDFQRQNTPGQGQYGQRPGVGVGGAANWQLM